MLQRSLRRMLGDFPMLGFVLLHCVGHRVCYPNMFELDSNTFEIRARNARPTDFQEPLQRTQTDYEYPRGYKGIIRARIFFCYHDDQDYGVLEVMPAKKRGKTIRLEDIRMQAQKDLWRETIDCAIIVSEHFHRETAERPFSLGLVRVEIIKSTSGADWNRMLTVSKHNDPSA